MGNNEIRQSVPDDDEIEAFERGKKKKLGAEVYGPPAPKPPSDDSDDDAR